MNNSDFDSVVATIHSLADLLTAGWRKVHPERAGSVPYHANDLRQLAREIAANRAMYVKEGKK